MSTPSVQSPSGSTYAAHSKISLVARSTPGREERKRGGPRIVHVALHHVPDELSVRLSAREIPGHVDHTEVLLSRAGEMRRLVI